MIDGDFLTPTRPPELALSVLWNEQRFSGPLTTTDGRSVSVIHRGSWTHGFGPDFRDAMIALDGREILTGSVEIHLTTREWREHGHHLDPRYDAVVLHVVLDHDGSETRRADGGLVPVAVLPVPFPLRQQLVAPEHDWSRVGGDICAEDLSRDQPAEIRSILAQLGDVRIAAKSARLEARLTDLPPGDVLYQELFDGLGFAANRDPMRELASCLPLGELDQILGTVSLDKRIDVARGLIFGLAGFLPFSPSDAAMARLTNDDVARAEESWRTLGAAWHGATLAPTDWTRARVRPANHPALRLSAGAAILANAHGGLVAALLAPLQSGSDPVSTLRQMATWNGEIGIGTDRAIGIVINGIIPFALALAEQNGDRDLSERAATALESLPPAESNDVTRRALRQVAGSTRIPKISARTQQGLIHLDTTLCAPRRCYECPIARRVVGGESGGD